MRKDLYSIFLINSLVLFLLSIFFPIHTYAIVIRGSHVVAPLAEAFAQSLKAQDPNLSISVQEVGSGVGIASLIDGSCDIAVSIRPIRDEEVYNAIRHGVDPKGYMIAMDCIAVVVHPSNSVKELTKDQLKYIYTGKNAYWGEVGGNAGLMIVISHEGSSETGKLFNEFVLGNDVIKSNTILLTSSSMVAATVATTVGAIGYVELGYVGNNLKAIPVNRVMPSKESVHSGAYPLSRKLYMYTNGQPEGSVKAFIDCVLSERGQKFIEEIGYIGIP